MAKSWDAGEATVRVLGGDLSLFAFAVVKYITFPFPRDVPARFPLFFCFLVNVHVSGPERSISSRLDWRFSSLDLGAYFCILSTARYPAMVSHCQTDLQESAHRLTLHLTRRRLHSSQAREILFPQARGLWPEAFASAVS